MRFLAEAGVGPARRFERIDGGGNNQVFKVETSEKAVALKAYFHHPDDPRDRFNAEYAFSTLAWQHGLRELPRPLAVDRQARLGLYEFVEGRRLTADEVDAGAIDAALAFIAAVNAPAVRKDGGALPVASEACFSLSAHLQTVQRRLQRLAGLNGAPPGTDVGGFVAAEVLPFWRHLEATTYDAAERLGLARDAEIPQQGRCISPSDFGFHNALRDAPGRLRFLDFEYAGWDDPAKLVGDFFNQVAVPVPPALFGAFARSVAGLFPEPDRNLARFELLMPVYAVKWIAIMLNDFLAEGETRRSFAGGAAEASQRKTNQLIKARRAFAALQSAAGVSPQGVS